MSHLSKYYTTNVIIKIVLIVFSILINFSFQYNTIDPVFYTKSLSLTFFLIGINIYYLKKNTPYHSISKFYQALTFSMLFLICYSVSKSYVFNHSITKLIPLILLFISTLSISNLLKTKAIQPYFLIKLLVFIVSLHTMIGILQYFNLGFRMLPPYELFPNSTLVNKNLFASYIIISLPLILHIKNIYLKVILIFSLSMIIVISGSRSGFIGLLIFYIYLFFVLKQNKKKLIALFIMALLITVFFSDYFPMLRNKIIELYDMISNIKNSDIIANSLKERIVLWECTLNMIKDHIIFGVGIGNWEFKIWEYKPENIISNYQNIALLRPHNQLLKIFAENGIFTLSIFIYLYFTSLKTAFKTKRKIYFLSLLLLLLFCIVDFPLESLSHVFLLSVIISLIHHSKNMENKTILNNNTNTNKIFILSQTIILFIIMLFIAYKTNSAVIYKKAISLHMQSKYRSSLNELSKVDQYVYTVDPLINPINQLKAINFSKLNNDSLALYHLKESEVIMENFPYYRYNLALAYIKTGEYKKAQPHIEYAKERIHKFKLMEKIN